MEKRKVKYKGRPKMYTVDAFDKLPTRCKELFFELLENDLMNNTHNASELCLGFSFDYEGCKSPIEIIFGFAFDVVTVIRRKEFDYCLYLCPQYDVMCGDKKYIADFCVEADDLDDWDHELYEKRILVECDGHEFHAKNKAQVARDNRRDMDLKMAEYEVIHFSGSQIYNEPYECANKLFDYIVQTEKQLREKSHDGEK